MAATHPVVFALATIGGLCLAASILTVGIALIITKLEDWL